MKQTLNTRLEKVTQIAKRKKHHQCSILMLLGPSSPKMISQKKLVQKPIKMN